MLNELVGKRTRRTAMLNIGATIYVCRLARVKNSRTCSDMSPAHSLVSDFKAAQRRIIT